VVRQTLEYFGQQDGFVISNQTLINSKSEVNPLLAASTNKAIELPKLHIPSLTNIISSNSNDRNNNTDNSNNSNNNNNNNNTPSLASSSPHTAIQNKPPKKSLLDIFLDKFPLFDKECVWRHMYGAEESGICLGCDKNRIVAPLQNWHCARIIRHVKDCNWNLLPFCDQCYNKTKKEENMIDWFGEHMASKNLKLILTLLLISYGNQLKKYDKDFYFPYKGSILRLAKELYGAKKLQTYLPQLNLNASDCACIWFCEEKEFNEKVYIIRHSTELITKLADFSQAAFKQSTNPSNSGMANNANIRSQATQNRN